MSNVQWPNFTLILRARNVQREGLSQKERNRRRLEIREKYSYLPENIKSAMVQNEESLFGLAMLEELAGIYPVYECIEAELHGGFDPNTLMPLKNRVANEEDEDEIKALRELGEKEYIRRRNLAQYEILRREIGDWLQEESSSEDAKKLLRWYNEWDKAFLKCFADWGITLPVAVEEKNSKKSTRFFSEFDNLHWEEICLIFVSPGLVSVAARGEHDHYSYVELGFEDKRKKSWDSRWEILRDDFARNNGVVSKSNRETMYTGFVIAVHEINKRLVSFFGIAENPLYHDKKSRIYRTKLKSIEDKIPYPG